MKLRVISLVVLFAISPVAVDAYAIDHSLLTEVLKEYVKNGSVDYKGLKDDSRFLKYIQLLEGSDPTAIQPEDTLAYWLNVYNAFTLKVICDHYPLESIRDLNTGPLVFAYALKTTVWDKKFVTLNGKPYTLSEVEHEHLRTTGDARVHFAMVCAAKSCPSLRPEAYTTANLNAQLNEQGRLFMSQPYKNRFDLPRNKKIVISTIFDWFEEDFVRDSGSVVKFIARFVPSEVAQQLISLEQDLDIDYTEYDWSLNE